MAILTTPVLIAAAALALFFLAMGALNTWGEKHRHENPYLNRGTDATDHHQRCSGNTRARNIGDDRPSFQQLAERVVYANQGLRKHWMPSTHWKSWILSLCEPPRISSGSANSRPSTSLASMNAMAT